MRFRLALIQVFPKYTLFREQEWSIIAVRLVLISIDFWKDVCAQLANSERQRWDGVRCTSRATARGVYPCLCSRLARNAQARFAQFPLNRAGNYHL